MDYIKKLLEQSRSQNPEGILRNKLKSMGDDYSRGSAFLEVVRKLREQLLGTKNE